jgi:hypothetical protein
LELHGTDRLTCPEKSLLGQLRVAMLVMGIGSAYIVKVGFPQALPAASLMATYANLARRNLVALERKAEPAGDSLEGIIGQLSCNRVTCAKDVPRSALLGRARIAEKQVLGE